MKSEKFQGIAAGVMMATLLVAVVLVLVMVAVPH